MNFLKKLDQDWTVFFNAKLHNGFLDLTMMGLSSDWLYVCIGVIFVLLALFYKKPRIIIYLALAIACAGAADYISYEWLKPFFSRLRPCHELSLGIRIVDHCGGQYGFPSNHATNAMASAGFVYLAIRNRIRYVFLAIALLVGFSRVYLGVHYLGDVLAGFCFGFLCAFLFFHLAQRIARLLDLDWCQSLDCPR